MATCKYCAKGKHAKCVRRNADKVTECPANCQHRVPGNTCAPGCDYPLTGHLVDREGKVLCDV